MSQNLFSHSYKFALVTGRRLTAVKMIKVIVDTLTAACRPGTAAAIVSLPLVPLAHSTYTPLLGDSNRGVHGTGAAPSTVTKMSVSVRRGGWRLQMCGCLTIHLQKAVKYVHAVHAWKATHRAYHQFTCKNLQSAVLAGSSVANQYKIEASQASV